MERRACRTSSNIGAEELPYPLSIFDLLGWSLRLFLIDSIELTATSNGIYPTCGVGMHSTTASAPVLFLARFSTSVSGYHGPAVKSVAHLTRIITVGPTFIGPIQGYLLDNAKWSRKTRARVAVVSFTILTLLTCEKNILYFFLHLCSLLICLIQGSTVLSSNTSTINRLQS